LLLVVDLLVVMPFHLRGEARADLAGDDGHGERLPLRLA